MRFFLYHEQGDKSRKTERYLHPRCSLCASFKSAGDNAGLKRRLLDASGADGGGEGKEIKKGGCCLLRSKSCLTVAAAEDLQ